MNRDKLEQGLGMFLDAMRPYVVSVIQKECPKSTSWDIDFECRITNELKRSNWQKQRKQLISNGSSLLGLIDYNNLVTFVINYRESVIKELGNITKNYNRLRNCLQELQDTRNNWAHFDTNGIDEDEAERAFSNMIQVSKMLKLTDLEMELKSIKSVEPTISEETPIKESEQEQLALDDVKTSTNNPNNILETPERKDIEKELNNDEIAERTVSEETVAIKTNQKPLTKEVMKGISNAITTGEDLSNSITTEEDLIKAIIKELAPLRGIEESALKRILNRITVWSKDSVSLKIIETPNFTKSLSECIGNFLNVEPEIIIKKEIPKESNTVILKNKVYITLPDEEKEEGQDSVKASITIIEGKEYVVDHDQKWYYRLNFNKKSEYCIGREGKRDNDISIIDKKETKGISRSHAIIRFDTNKRLFVLVVEKAGDPTYKTITRIGDKIIGDKYERKLSNDDLIVLSDDKHDLIKMRFKIK